MSKRKQLAALVLAALAVRLVFVFRWGASFNDLWNSDSYWYLLVGKDLVHMSEAAPIPSGPLYLVFLGALANLMPLEAAVWAAEWIQALLGALTVGLVYLWGRRVWAHRVGMAAGAAVALGPAFIIDTGKLLTEPLFMCLFMASLVYYTWRAEAAPGPGDMAVVGLLLGLAALTRGVVLAFPAVLIVDLVLRHGWRRALRHTSVLLLVFVLTLAPWTLYNVARWDHFVIAAEGFSSFFFLGTQEAGWTGPTQVDASMEAEPVGPDARAVASIREDPLGWLALRVRNLGSALLQPHNTAHFPGESLKTRAAQWWAEDRSVSGLGALMRGEQFWPKLILYLLHFTALVGGLVGMMLARRRAAFLLYATVGYFLAVHMFLYAIPRYLFPVEPVWWLFAAFALVWVWDALHDKRTNAV